MKILHRTVLLLCASAAMSTPLSGQASPRACITPEQVSGLVAEGLSNILLKDMDLQEGGLSSSSRQLVDRILATPSSERMGLFCPGIREDPIMSLMVAAMIREWPEQPRPGPESIGCRVADGSVVAAVDEFTGWIKSNSVTLLPFWEEERSGEPLADGQRQALDQAAQSLRPLAISRFLEAGRASVFLKSVLAEGEVERLEAQVGAEFCSGIDQLLAEVFALGAIYQSLEGGL